MFDPQNEMGVVVLFSQICESYGWKLVKVQSGFPDAVVEEMVTRKFYKAEFEYLASNFILHKHDPRKCDMIICWKNDFSSSLLPIMSLQNMENFFFREIDFSEKEKMHEGIKNKIIKKDVTERKPIERIVKSTNERKRNGVVNNPNGLKSTIYKEDGTMIVNVHITLKPGEDDEVIEEIENAKNYKVAATIREMMRRGLEKMEKNNNFPSL